MKNRRWALALNIIVVMVAVCWRSLILDGVIPDWTKFPAMAGLVLLYVALWKAGKWINGR